MYKSVFLIHKGKILKNKKKRGTDVNKKTVINAVSHWLSTSYPQNVDNRGIICEYIVETPQIQGIFYPQSLLWEKPRFHKNKAENPSVF